MKPGQIIVTPLPQADGLTKSRPVLVPRRIIGIIPARYASTRFPGKPLALIAGKPLIQHVVEQCQKAKSLSEVIVATDDTRIWEVAQKFCRVEMTRPDHPSGTDRIAEVAGSDCLRRRGEHPGRRTAD